MPTFYRKKGRTEWKKIDDNIILTEFGLTKLYEMDGQDSDNGYSEYIEFDRNGVRTYMAGLYDPFSNDDHYPTLENWEYGDEEKINKFLKDEYGDSRVERYPFGPNRDWMKLSKYDVPCKWPRGDL